MNISSPTMIRSLGVRTRNVRVQHYARRFLKTTPEKGDKVVIAMSGGVDSSVAALKLAEKVVTCLWNGKALV